jgi:sugar phosphate isomerase/epimerase
LAKELEVCQKMGVRYMFISPKHKWLSKVATYKKLRELGDIAKKCGVTIGAHR